MAILVIKKIPSNIKGLLGFITAIISFVLLFQRNTDLTITILSTLVILSLFIGCLYIAFSKTSSVVIADRRKLYRYPPKQRRLALVGALIILIVIAYFILWNPSRDFAIRSLSGKEYLFSEGPVTIEQLLISKQGTYYQLEPTVKNSLGKEILVKEISLKGRNPSFALCCCPPSSTYKVSDKFQVATINSDQSVDINSTVYRVFEKNKSESEYALRGRFWDDNCSANGFKLMFNTSFTLPSKSYSSFHVKFPQSINVNLSSGPHIQPIQSYKQITLEIFVNFQDEPIKATTSQTSSVSLSNKHMQTDKSLDKLVFCR